MEGTIPATVYAQVVDWLLNEINEQSGPMKRTQELYTEGTTEIFSKVSRASDGQKAKAITNSTLWNRRSFLRVSLYGIQGRGSEKAWKYRCISAMNPGSVTCSGSFYNVMAVYYILGRRSAGTVEVSSLSVWTTKSEVSTLRSLTAGRY